MHTSIRKTWYLLAMVLTTFVPAKAILAQDPELPTTGNTTAQSNAIESQSIYSNVPQFGGPSSVGGQLAEDAAVVPEFRWQGLQDAFEP